MTETDERRQRQTNERTTTTTALEYRTEKRRQTDGRKQQQRRKQTRTPSPFPSPLRGGRRPPVVTPSLSSLNAVHTLTSQPRPSLEQKELKLFFSRLVCFQAKPATSRGPLHSKLALIFSHSFSDRFRSRNRASSGSFRRARFVAEGFSFSREVKYCFECGEYRDFKCCHGCFQTCCRDSAKVTDGTGGDDSRVFQGTKG